MAKKTAQTRSAAQRNKPKTQKSIELVRPTSTETENEGDSSLDNVVATAIATATTTEPAATITELAQEGTRSAAANSTVPKTSASARLAARRQVVQKSQRSTANLITAEHYRYVRNDLIYIAILAAIMFSILIVLFFVLR